MISVLILTYNEELDLPGCLDSIAWCDDIHVLDSNSTDATRSIAAARGAHVTVRPFDNYAAQRNAGMQLPFKYPWVFVLDADERPTPTLSAEMPLAVASAASTVSAFRLRRRDFLWGTWLKHAQLTPFYIRLLRVGHARYTRDVNEIAEIGGDILSLNAPLDHLAFSKGISHWITKHNTYATFEATLLADGIATQNASLHQALFASDFHARRVAQKAIFYKLPLRPLIKWTYMMLIRGAILDGRAGITYATLQSFYEFLIDTKRREILRRRSGLPL
jgi:glycosyltransferase involved in cell wall biosynthesis